MRIPPQIKACEESLLMPRPQRVCEKPPQRPREDEIKLIFHSGVPMFLLFQFSLTLSAQREAGERSAG